MASSPRPHRSRWPRPRWPWPSGHGEVVMAGWSRPRWSRRRWRTRSSRPHRATPSMPRRCNRGRKGLRESAEKGDSRAQARRDLAAPPPGPAPGSGSGAAALRRIGRAGQEGRCPPPQGRQGRPGARRRSPEGRSAAQAARPARPPARASARHKPEHRPDRHDRRQGHGGGRRDERPQRQLRHSASPAPKAGVDPDSPFAALSSLKAALEKRGQE